MTCKRNQQLMKPKMSSYFFSKENFLYFSIVCFSSLPLRPSPNNVAHRLTMSSTLATVKLKKEKKKKTEGVGGNRRRGSLSNLHWSKWWIRSLGSEFSKVQSSPHDPPNRNPIRRRREKKIKNGGVSHWERIKGYDNISPPPQGEQNLKNKVGKKATNKKINQQQLAHTHSWRRAKKNMYPISSLAVCLCVCVLRSYIVVDSRR